MQIEYEILRIFHDIATAWGVGSVTLGFLLMLLGDRDKEITPVLDKKVMPLLAKLAMLGLLILVGTGVGLYLLSPWPLGDVYYIKHIVVAILVGTGVFMGAYVLPKRRRLKPPPGNPPSKEFLQVKKLARMLRLINLILWYLIVVLSVIL